MNTPGSRKPTGRRWAAVLAAGSMVVPALQGCGLHVYRAPVRPAPADPGLSPIGRALAYLDETQVKEVQHPFAGGADFPGNWPQYVLINFPVRLRARDVSPFIPAAIHHSLALIHEDTQAALGLESRQIARARAMRQASVEFMHRFEAPPGADLAGAYGFWPQEEVAIWQKPWLGRVRGDWMAGPFFWLFTDGPALEGPLYPLNVPQIPRAYGIHPDADDTAVIYAALWEAHRLDSAPEPNPPFHLFAEWRHTGREDLLADPDWLPEASGAFLTWFGSRRNDVDLVVNANVLYMLARFGRLGTEGAGDAQALIRNAIAGRMAGSVRDDIEQYYPNPMVAYHGIVRAFRSGPVPGLEPAALQIADTLRRHARFRNDGSVFWHFGQPALDTALGILILLDTGQHLDLVPGAVQSLLRWQNRRRGYWPEGYVFGGRSGRGHRVNWASAPASTAFALEALCRFVLAAEDRSDPRWQNLAELARRPIRTR